jgi:hypothetical protein
VACSCSPASWKPGIVDDLMLAFLVLSASRRLGVRTKLSINMGALGEIWVARLVKESRDGPGRKLTPTVTWLDCNIPDTTRRNTNREEED